MEGLEAWALGMLLSLQTAKPLAKDTKKPQHAGSSGNVMWCASSKSEPRRGIRIAPLRDPALIHSPTWHDDAVTLVVNFNAFLSSRSVVLDMPVAETHNTLPHFQILDFSRPVHSGHSSPKPCTPRPCTLHDHLRPMTVVSLCCMSMLAADMGRLDARDVAHGADDAIVLQTGGCRK